MINDLDNGPLYSRLHKSSCCEASVPACNCCWHACRKAVSGKKTRYEKDGYDLDMTYLGPSKRVLTHGFPAIGIEHMYRNPRYEIKRYLEEHHAGNYKVFNFCCEPGRGYSADVFDGRVERYPFKDHNTPPLETMIEFGESAKKWLDESPDHMCSLHCKAGKGRAGLMTCILLLRSGEFQSALEVLDHYDATRVSNNRGLTVTSQRKFVIFYELLWRQYYGESGNIGAVPGSLPLERKVPVQPTLHLSEVEILNCKLPKGLKNVRIMIYKGGNMAPRLLYDTGKLKDGEAKALTPCILQGNFKIHVEHKPSFFGKEVKICELWHNTLFVDRGALIIDFMLDQLDVKRKLEKALGAQFTLRVKLSKEPPSEGETAPGRAVEKGAKNEAKKEKEYEMVSTHEEEAEIAEAEALGMDADTAA